MAADKDLKVKNGLTAGGPISVTSTGEMLSLTTSGDTALTALNYIRFHDSTGNRGYLGYGGTADTFTLDSSTSSTLAVIAATTLNLRTGNATRAAVTNAGVAVTGALTVTSSSAGYYTPITLTNSVAGALSVQLFGGDLANATAGDAMISSTTGSIIISPNATSKTIKLIPGIWSSTVVAEVASSGVVVNGVVEAGDVTATTGAVLLRPHYSAGDTPCLLGTMYSSGAMMMGYGVASSQSASGNTFVSSYAQTGLNRGALVVDGALTYYSAPSQTTPLGTAVAMVPLLTINSSGTTFGGQITAGGLINTAPGSSIYFNNSANNAVYAIYNGAASGATDLRFRAGGVDNITISSTGSVGFGVTPSVWQSGTRAIDGPDSGIWFRGPGNGTDIVSNGYYTGSAWVFKNTGPLTRYSVQAGNFQWMSAPSQVAGTTILTTAMTSLMSLESNGNLTLGYPNNGEKLGLYSTGTGDSISLRLGTTVPTGAIGMARRIQWTLNDASSALINTNSIRSEWTDAGAGARQSKLVITSQSGNNQADAVTIDWGGNVTIVGPIYSQGGLAQYVLSASNYGGSGITQSMFGDVPTAGTLYIVETGTGKYINATFYKQGSAYSPVVTILASNGLTIVATNDGGTVQTGGYTVGANVKMRAIIYNVAAGL